MYRTAEAIEEYYSVLDIAKRNQFNLEIEYVFNGLAIAYTYQANYAAALRLHNECLLMREKEGNCEGMCTTLLNIGMVYYYLCNNEKALEYSERSLILAKEIGYTIDRDRLLINMGIDYGALGNHSESIRLITEGLRFCGVHCSDKIKLAGYHGFGLSFFIKSELDSAEFYFLKSCSLAEKIGDRFFEVHNLIKLAEIKVRMNQTNSAFGFLSQAEPLASQGGFNIVLLNIYQQFATIHDRRRDLSHSAQYLSKYIHLRDSLYDEDMINNVSRVQTEIEERKNKARIVYQEEVLKVKQESMDRQQMFILLGCILAIFLVTLASVLYYTNRRRQRINVLLDKKVKERTFDLEQSFHALKRTQDEQAELIQKTSRQLNATISTFQGLCLSASKESESAVLYNNYIRQFTATTTQLTAVHNLLKGGEDVGETKNGSRQRSKDS